MVIGLGLDLCEIDRIESMIERWGSRFLDKIFTEHEREYARSKSQAAQHFAARFAVKEATLKALGVPKGLRWHEMEVRGGGNRAPTLSLSGAAAAAAARLGAERFTITISHGGGIAAAVVIAESKETP